MTRWSWLQSCFGPGWSSLAPVLMPASSTMLESRRCPTPLSHSLVFFPTLSIIITLSICPLFGVCSHPPRPPSPVLFLFHTNTNLLNRLFLPFLDFFHTSCTLFVIHMLSAMFTPTHTHTPCISPSCTHPDPDFSFCLAYKWSFFFHYPVFMMRMFLELHHVLSFFIGTCPWDTPTRALCPFHVHMATFWISWPRLCSFSITLNLQDQALSQNMLTV